MKKLPINLKPPIITECWSFYRLSILNQTNYFNDWFINHFNNLTMNDQYSIYYGENGYQYNQLHYYNELLKTDYINISNIDSCEEFCNILINLINDDTYCVIECDCNVINEQEETYIHELFIYGYDNDYFICSYLENNIWIEDKIHCGNAFKAFEKRRKIDNITKESNYLSYRTYRYPFMTLKLKKNIDYKCNIYMFQQDLDKAFYSSYKFDYNKSSMYNYINRKIWYGPCGVINGLIEYLDTFINNKLASFDYYKANINMKKCCEYHDLMYKKIQKVNREFNINLPDYIFDLYQLEINNFNICLSLCIKSGEAENIENLIKAKERLSIIKTKIENIYGDLLARMNQYIINNYE